MIPLVLLALLIAIPGAILGNLWWKRVQAEAQFRRTYGPSGKDLLLVFSESPNWKSYIEEHWLPRWGERAVLLNWSDRSRWSEASPEVAVFRSVAGDREFNPLAVVIPASGGMTVIRFWQAFRDYKHGKDAVLRAKQLQLESALGDRGPDSLGDDA